jgi:hypothetical protein
MHKISVTKLSENCNEVVLYGSLPPKPPISLICGKFGVCLGVPITVLFKAVFHAQNAKWNTKDTD